MPISPYLGELRAVVGHRLILCPGVAAVIRDGAGRVLFLRRSDDGRWGLPAGSIDPGEAPAQCVAREVWEETGLRVRPERIVGVFGGEPMFRVTYPNGDCAEYTVTVFECGVVGGRLEPRDGEALELRYFAPNSLPDGVSPISAYVCGLASHGPAALFRWEEGWLDALVEEHRP